MRHYREAILSIRTDRSEGNDLDTLLGVVIENRMAHGGRGGVVFPVADLKFQDVLELRVE